MAFEPADSKIMSEKISGSSTMQCRLSRGVVAIVFVATSAIGQERTMLEQAPNTWVKRSPLPDAPPSPMLRYEGSSGYGPNNRRLIRWAYHDQGGGGEQNAETRTFDPVTAGSTLKEPNLSPPAFCGIQENVFDPA